MSFWPSLLPHWVDMVISAVSWKAFGISSTSIHIQIFTYTLHTIISNAYYEDNVDLVILRLWTTATSGTIVHLSSDIWVWTAMMYLYQHFKTDWSTRTIWKSYKTESSSSKLRRTWWRKWRIWPSKYLYCVVISTCRKIWQHGANGFNSSPKDGVLRILIAL
jgi:hypothetical protein